MCVCGKASPWWSGLRPIIPSYTSNTEEVGQALVWLICACVGKLRNAIIFSSKVKRGQGEQLQAATFRLCESQRSVVSSSVDRAELANSCQLFRFT